MGLLYKHNYLICMHILLPFLLMCFFLITLLPLFFEYYNLKPISHLSSLLFPFSSLIYFYYIDILYLSHFICFFKNFKFSMSLNLSSLPLFKFIKFYYLLFPSHRCTISPSHRHAITPLHLFKLAVT